MTAAGLPEPGGAPLSIGSVLDALRAEFPEITISKIRFLESEGLIRPARTPAGYRQFSHDDVVRLRFVLSAQRDHYLPLKVIKEQLDAALAETGDEVVEDLLRHANVAMYAAKGNGKGRFELYNAALDALVEPSGGEEGGDDDTTNRGRLVVLVLRHVFACPRRAGTRGAGARGGRRGAGSGEVELRGPGPQDRGVDSRGPGGGPEHSSPSSGLPCPPAPWGHQANSLYIRCAVCAVPRRRCPRHPGPGRGLTARRRGYAAYRERT